MKKKLIAAILTGAMLAAGLTTSVWADGEKTFVYGTTGYSEEMGDAGLNPHDNYSGCSLGNSQRKSRRLSHEPARYRP